MSFDRDAAVREWRLSFLSRGGLTVSELDELQDHLELVEAELKESLGPEEAFWVAAHRIGTPDALTREFAKVRPNMGWEVRAQWALLGLLAYRLLVPAASAVLYLLVGLLARVPGMEGVGALVRPFASTASLLLVLVLSAWVIKASRASPMVVDRAVGSVASKGWTGFWVAVAAVVALQFGVDMLHVRALMFTTPPVAAEGPVAVRFSLGGWANLASGYAFVVMLLAAVFWLQWRLARYRPAAGGASPAEE